MSEPVWLGLGGNVGDVLTTLAAAVLALDDVEGLEVRDTSAVYRSAPWPPPDDPRSVAQDDFLNLVVEAETALGPHELLGETVAIETAFGRERRHETRWGPRILDIDLLLMGDRRVETPELTLPHPRLTERAFVLVPLLEVAPGATLPDGRRLARELARLAPIEGIELDVRLEELPSHRVVRPAGPSGPPASFRRPGPDPDVARGEE